VIRKGVGLMGYYDNNFKQPFRGDVFNVDLQGMEGEKKGYRPAIIISNNIGNKYSQYVVVVTCSSCRPKLPTHTQIQLDKTTTVMTERVHTIHRDRLQTFIRRCTSEEMKNIDDTFKMSMGLIRIPDDKGIHDIH
jgi:mRNA interferase MazF